MTPGGPQALAYTRELALTVCFFRENKRFFDCFFVFLYSKCANRMMHLGLPDILSSADSSRIYRNRIAAGIESIHML